MTENLKQKVKFVKQIEKALVGKVKNIKSVEYKILTYPQYEASDEFLVITYVGDDRTVRNCTGNSFTAIYTEIGKYLNSGYYDEVEFFDALVASNKCYVEEE